MGEKITQAMALEVWTLATPADMFTCLEELFAQGYRGQVQCFWTTAAVSDPPQDGPVAHWHVEVNSPDDTRPSVLAILGDSVVLFGGVLEAMTAETYAARFGDAP